MRLLVYGFGGILRWLTTFHLRGKIPQLPSARAKPHPDLSSTALRSCCLSRRWPNQAIAPRAEPSQEKATSFSTRMASWQYQNDRRIVGGRVYVRRGSLSYSSAVGFGVTPRGPTPRFGFAEALTVRVREFGSDFFRSAVTVSDDKKASSDLRSLELRRP